ncbi:hypothetical protein DMENIID0001_036460 [Sergentomyia squamirostris]
MTSTSENQTILLRKDYQKANNNMTGKKEKEGKVAPATKVTQNKGKIAATGAIPKIPTGQRSAVTLLGDGKATQEVTINKNTGENPPPEFRYRTNDRGPFTVVLQALNLDALELGKMITGTIGHSKIETIRVFGRNKVRLRTKDPISANKILNSEEIKTVPGLKVFVPKFYVYSEGVISDIHTKHDVGDLKNNIAADSEIVEVIRLTRWDATSRAVVEMDKIKVVFRSTTLPRTAEIYGISMRVAFFVPSPLFCKKCLSYGHFKKHCKANQDLCETCTLSHDSDDEKKKCRIIFCKFCKTNDHQTNHKICPEKQRQIRTRRVMVEQKLTFWEAKKEMKKAVDFNSVLPPPPLQTSFADTVRMKEQEEIIRKLREMLGKIRNKVCSTDTRGHEDIIVPEILEIMESNLTIQ